MLSAGVVLSGRYQLNERVAAGGMGEVWRCTDVLLRREVAVKVLLPSLISDAEFIARFRTEARMMAALRHQGIVQVYDYGEEAEVGGDRLDYLVMEYIEGAPLSQWIKSMGRLGVAETLSVVTQAAQALHVAHSAGIVHRDVKPSNLLVRPDGVIVLVDFGVARSADVTGLTGTNVVLGTAHYMAPEQATGQPVSAETDIYALGAVAYCCLTGRPPFIGDNPLHVVAQHLQGEPPALPPEIPAPVAALVARALAKDPAGRYPSAAVFAEAARAAQSSPPAGSAPMASAPAASASVGNPPVGNPPAASPPAASAPVGNPPVGNPPVGNQPPGGGAGVAHGAFDAGYGPFANSPRIVPTPPNNRRRKLVLAGVAGAVVIGLASTAVGFAFTSAEAQSSDRPAAAPSVGAAPLSPGSGPVPGPGSGTGTEAGEPAASAATRTAKPAKTSAKPTGPAATGTTPPAGGPTAPGSSGPAATATKTTEAATQKNPYTAAQACGSGYQVIDSATLSGSGGASPGKVYLLYHSGTGANCTVTLKSTAVGTATTASAYLEVKGSARATDSGSFKYYAGPVRAKAAGVCVKWGGSTGGASYNSPFEHCD
ncbi:serine/threonine protein kinase [Actinoplanes sp. ATCC 53533]|uniref:serine/threonine-protein kinase n=1 Tax=Actinoplanes sp. ATCC 53533 TaxID=1288362 RepID=UPI000F77F9CB|nr:serine/threonine-protein kinase [Actinoplanes sp. ATCC 53533]RSM47462.1 serine/threonine protein kinase [Actinoplanes sp. ATCC 53533]